MFAGQLQSRSSFQWKQFLSQVFPNNMGRWLCSCLLTVFRSSIVAKGSVIGKVGLFSDIITFGTGLLHSCLRRSRCTPFCLMQNRFVYHFFTIGLFISHFPVFPSITISEVPSDICFNSVRWLSLK